MLKTNIQVVDHLYASRHYNKAVHNIPNIQVCGLMGPVWPCFRFDCKHVQYINTCN